MNIIEARVVSRKYGMSEITKVVFACASKFKNGFKESTFRKHTINVKIFMTGSTKCIF